MPQAQFGPSPIFRWAAILGGLTIALFLALAVSGPDAACGGDPNSPALAFQSVRSPADLSAVLGPEGSACRASLTEALREGARLDLWLFIPLYAAFFSLVTRAVSTSSKAMARLAFLTLILTAAGDIVETTAQLQALVERDVASSPLALIALGNMTKTVGLGLLMLGLAVVLRTSPAFADRSIATALAVCAMARFASLAGAELKVVGALSALCLYVALTVFCVLRARDSSQN